MHPNKRLKGERQLVGGVTCGRAFKLPQKVASGEISNDATQLSHLDTDRQ